MNQSSVAVASAPAVAAPSAVAVSLRQVNKSFGSGNTYLPVLKDINLEVRRGELLLLVGPSGCGKTTLLSVMAGILDVDQGVVDVFGIRVDQLSQSRKTRFRQENIGFIFQQFNLIPTLTATENVAVPLIIAGKPYQAALEQARHYLTLVGLGERLEHFPTQLSGGQQQRVAIARALVAEPRLVVCDEPTAALDSATGQLVMEMFREVALSPERAIVIVTHDNRIFPYGDRIAEMLDGRIVDVHDNPNRMR